MMLVHHICWRQMSIMYALKMSFKVYVDIPWNIQHLSSEHILPSSKIQHFLSMQRCLEYDRHNTINIQVIHILSNILNKNHHATKISLKPGNIFKIFALVNYWVAFGSDNDIPTFRNHLSHCWLVVNFIPKQQPTVKFEPKQHLFGTNLHFEMLSAKWQLLWSSPDMLMQHPKKKLQGKSENEQAIFI